ncbi:hypothetical protein [Rhodopirellula baltica]
MNIQTTKPPCLQATLSLGAKLSTWMILKLQDVQVLSRAFENAGWMLSKRPGCDGLKK